VEKLQEKLYPLEILCVMVMLPRDVVECALANEPQCEAKKLKETFAPTE